MFEEHEKPCDFICLWTRDTTNQLRLLERKDKYALFKTPQVSVRVFYIERLTRVRVPFVKCTVLKFSVLEEVNHH